jgi:hypothetical protein
MRDRGMRFEKAIEFLMDKTHNDIKTIFGYIEQIHQKKDIEIINVDIMHPLMDKVWRNSSIDFNEIKNKYKEFDEKPSK